MIDSRELVKCGKWTFICSNTVKCEFCSRQIREWVYLLRNEAEVMSVIVVI